jgi:hypothetical protein
VFNIELKSELEKLMIKRIMHGDHVLFARYLEKKLTNMKISKDRMFVEIGKSSLTSEHEDFVPDVDCLINVLNSSPLLYEVLDDFVNKNITYITSGRINELCNNN